MPLRRADRLFDILRLLRAAAGPVTASALAESLEVTPRTIYRDIATMQGRRIPIEGAAGIGYVLRRGFDLPPLMFTEDEAEAIAVAMRMLARTGDAGLQRAADSVVEADVVVPDCCDYLTSAPARLELERRPGAARLPSGSACDPRGAQDADAYRTGTATNARRVQPSRLSITSRQRRCAWCELRNDIRHFRTDRIVSAEMLDDNFAIPEAVIAEWAASHDDR